MSLRNKLIAASLLLSSFAFAQTTPQGVEYPATVLRVVDGDSIIIAAPYLPPPLKPQLSVRIYGVDTPEKAPHAKCELEATRALAASAYTRDAIKASTQKTLVLYGWDKYGGRVLGDILLNGQSLRSLLIQYGHAREYYGGGKKSWCN